MYMKTDCRNYKNEMFRKMRRSRQLLAPKENSAILERGKTAVLAVSGDKDYPYAVPVNFIYYNGKIYFHCAKTGHKLDAIRRNPKISVCVVDRDDILQSKYTTVYKSVVVFGTAKIMSSESEMRKVLRVFAEKYCPDYKEGIQNEIDREFSASCVVEISIDHMTGKQGIELVRGEV